MQPLKIQTKESASLHELKMNVVQNLDLMKDCQWLSHKYQVHDKEAIIVSYGNSFRENPEKLKEILKDKTNYTIFTVKHCLPLFKELGIDPDYCVILDPREVLGVSTLGHKRADLFKDSTAKAYMVATMTHPSVTQLLLSLNKNLIGWHSACEAMKDPEVAAKVPNWITGGSCSAMRAVSIARVMGYRTISLLGFDAVTDAPEGYKDRERNVFYSALESIGLKIDDDTKDQMFEQLVPAIQLYGARKASLLTKPDGDAKETSMTLLEHVADGSGEQKNSRMKVLIGDDIFWGTPELIAIGQDLEAIFKHNADIVYNIYSGGLCLAIWDLHGGEEKINPRPTTDLPK